MTSFPSKQNTTGAIPVFSGSFAVAPTTPFPATLAAGATYDSGVLPANGAHGLAASVTLDQNGTLFLTRYADAGGLAPIDEQTNQFAQAGSWGVSVADGVPFLSFRVQVRNDGNALGNLTNGAIVSR